MISAVKEASLPSMPMASRAAAMGASSKDHVDFADVLGEAIASASSTIKSSESATLAGISGGIPMYKVVESVMAAQRTLQATIAIRDKAVAAYQEISRMAI